MSYQCSGSDFWFPRSDARLDLTDLYAFSKPGGIGKSILTGDGVGPHSELLSELPYLGPPHNLRASGC
jgi:hypothetical protein